MSRRIRPALVAQRSVLYTLLGVVMLAFLLPLFWLISSAVKPGPEITAYPPVWLPSALHWQNFASAWTSVPFGQYLINSIIVTLAGTALTTINAALSAYALTFVRFPFKEVIFYVMLGALMIPGDVALVPNYITISNLGWLNTYQGIIIPTSAAVFGTFLMRQHMRTIPSEIIDAAKMDRAGHWHRMTRIVLPMSRPILITTVVISLVGDWNQFIWPLIVTNTDSMRTLPIGLTFLRSAEGSSDWGPIMAGTLMVALPMIIVFIVAQRQIIQGLTQGARPQ